jgi:hypothetical protein
MFEDFGLDRFAILCGVLLHIHVLLLLHVWMLLIWVLLKVCHVYHLPLCILTVHLGKHVRLVNLLLIIVIQPLVGQTLLVSTVVLLLLHPAKLCIFHIHILSWSSLILFGLVVIHDDTLSFLVLDGPGGMLNTDIACMWCE